jgi:peroxiredoxin family protein
LKSGKNKMKKETNKHSRLRLSEVDAAAGNHPVPCPQTCQMVGLRTSDNYGELLTVTRWKLKPLNS